jgi:hypothetical protein
MCTNSAIGAFERFRRISFAFGDLDEEGNRMEKEACLRAGSPPHPILRKHRHFPDSVTPMTFFFEQGNPLPGQSKSGAIK